MKRFLLSLSLLIAASLPWDCLALPAASAIPKETRTITDSRGRHVEVPSTTKRIALNHVSISEALKILGCWDRVVARDHHTTDSLVFDNLQDVPVITLQSGGPYSLNHELVIETAPDLFLCADISMGGFDEMEAKLSPGIPVFVVELNRISTLEENMELLGKVLGKEKEARAFTRWNRSLVRRITDRTGTLDDSRKQRYLFKTGWGQYDDIMTFTNDFEGIKERNRIIGGINVAADIRATGGWVQSVNPEWLAAQNIDVIICGEPVRNGYGAHVSDTGIVATQRQNFMKLPYVAVTHAAQTGRVHMISGEFFGTARITVANAYLAKWLHPKLFEDLNPQDVFQDYLHRFLNTDINLKETGVFTYPES
ncbi:ABC transporter substrate-binding protein [Desulfoluna butyratoxydans]|uniref:Abc transporter periplasmic binding domain n=1 Tax=Desulfoluna butyratoxydans TaxID=231438 RepID=A0A4U8YPX2_9BACT|nr:ABC transporter substrate-binding protein [Desulfoluna butyratoxydans]VFQ46276.1 abc transporter periplasmic binding domain [Desulfoluna butyratoxydans]